MDRNKLLFFIVMSVFIFQIAFAQTTGINNAGILVGWSDHNDTGFDSLQIERLQNMGYAVTVVQQEDIGSAFTIDDANALHLLVLSESVHSDFADPLIGTTTPIMNQETHAWDNWFHTGASVAADWQLGTMVDIVNDTHPIAAAAGLSVGPMTFYSTGTSFVSDVASNLAPGAELIAQMIPDGKSVNYTIAFAIDKGAELANGTPAPNRIVGFPLTGHYVVTAETMTDTAWALYDAAIAWLDPAAAHHDSLAAHWPMDEGEGTVVTDVVGGNNGTIVGLDPAAAWLADGGVRFDNTDGHHIEVPNSNVIDFGDESFTVSLLVRYLTPPLAEDTDRWIIKGTHFAPAGTGSRYEVFHTGGPSVRFSIDDNRQKGMLEVSDAAIVTGDWAHVVAIRDVVKDSIYIYANGVMQGAAYNYPADISNGEPLWIGESTDESATAMSGDIKDVRLYNYALNADEVVELFDSYDITVSISGEQSAKPMTYALKQNYPNPFNPRTKIEFQIPQDGHVTLSVYNMLGHRVAALIDWNLHSGMHQVTFNGTEFASGIYFYRIKAKGFSQVKKMMLLK